MKQDKRNAFELALIASVASLMLAGCGKLDFSQTLLHPLTPVSSSFNAQAVEVVSGSTTGEKTLVNGYTVDASVGSIRDKLQATTPNGYTVYNGVSGTIVSDEQQ